MARKRATVWGDIVGFIASPRPMYFTTGRRFTRTLTGRFASRKLRRARRRLA